MTTTKNGNLTFFYDTETTGLPKWKVPSEDPSQPHILQLGAILANTDTKEVVAELDVLVKPDGWVVPEEITELTGITHERALAEGIPEKEAVAEFLAMRASFERVAHNKTFDQRMIRIALKRFGFGDEAMDKWAQKEDHHCTMLKAKPIMKIGPKGRFGHKNPKLSEAYEHFIGKTLENAHTAMADARACMEIYFAMLEG